MIPAFVPNLTPLARVSIPEGTFTMGSALFEGSSPTEVTVSAFQISETKVTRGDYQEYLRAIGDYRWTLAVRNSETGDYTVAGRGMTENEMWKAYYDASPGARIDRGGAMVFEVTDPAMPPEFRESLDQPMVRINWWEMLAFAAAHGGDLPTEAEYERVQRGRSGKDEYGTLTGGLMTKDGEKLAQFNSDRTAPVRNYPADSWGAFDASGNAWTWTKDWAESIWFKDPRGPKEGTFRILCGGSYHSKGLGLHAAARLTLVPEERDEDAGGVVVWRS